MSARILWPVAMGMALAFAGGEASAQNAPGGLRGKSIVMAWTENRMQRPAGSGEQFRLRGIAQTLSIYVSTEGRLFSRRGATNPKGGGGKREGVGEQGTSGTGGLRSTRFQGETLVVSTELGSGARLITVSFASGFSGCSATVIVARQSGRQTMTVRSLADGSTFEVQSVSADGASCSIRDGNVFAQ